MNTPAHDKFSTINIALSSACGANCIYCPTDRGSAVPTKNMPIEVAKKIIDEITSESYIAKYGAPILSVGGNGDAFMNKQTIEILRYARQRRPSMFIVCFTNFQNLTPEKLEIILRERLMDQFGVNLDGANDLNYFSVKRINIKYVNNNLLAFFRLRRELNSPIRICVQVLTLYQYIRAVHHKFGKLPVKLTDPALVNIKDDFELIRGAVTPLLGPGDGVFRSAPWFWAERELADKSTLNYADYVCPQLDRIHSEAYIAPDGTWYACCLDSKCALNLGNVYETSVDAVASSSRRAALIRMLENRKFAEIGSPCDTVNCCYQGGLY